MVTKTDDYEISDSPFSVHFRKIWNNFKFDSSDQKNSYERPRSICNVRPRTRKLRLYCHSSVQKGVNAGEQHPPNKKNLIKVIIELL